MIEDNKDNPYTEPSMMYPVFGSDEYEELAEERREDEHFWKRNKKIEYSAARLAKARVEIEVFLDRYGR